MFGQVLRKGGSLWSRSLACILGTVGSEVLETKLGYYLLEFFEAHDEHVNKDDSQVM